MKILSLATLLLLCKLSWSQDSLRTVRLEEVAITAIRADENVPVPKTNFTKKQIDEVYVGQHPIFLIEKSTPGLYSYSESGTAMANYGQLRLRGINQERINFTLNGVPLNDMIDQGVFFSNFTDVASNFESIQVQRGVGTSSNGVSSYGGSVNFESLNLRNREAFTKMQLGGGSFETLRGNFQHFTGINEKGWGFMSSFSKLTSDGYRDNTNTDATSYFMTGGYYGDEELLKFTFFISRAENGLGYSTIEESILENDRTFNNLSNNDEDDFTQFLAQIQYNRFLSDDLILGVTGYYGGASGDFVTFGTNFPLENDHIGAIVNAEYFNGNLSLNTGLHLYAFQRKNEESNLDDLANPFYHEESQKHEFSSFIKAKYEYGRLSFYGDVQLRSTKLTITPDYPAVGIEPEGDIEFDWTFINPRIGANYQVNSNFSLYSSFGRSGREPTKIDIFGGFRLDSTNYESVRNGGSFKDEFVNDFEFGGRYLTQKLTIDGNFFLMNFDDEIAPNGATLEFGVGERRNIPKSRRSGAEILWTYLPSALLAFNGNIAYLNTKVEDLIIDGNVINDNEQVLSPDWIVNGQIKVTPSEMIGISLSGRYLGEQFMNLPNDSDFTVPSSFVLDALVEFKISKSIGLSAFINNLLDNEYETFGLPTDNDFDGSFERGFFVQPPRNYYFSLNINL
ncbi:MAG: TonB-dependent receptor [Bacteroidota bacterium]